MKAKFWDKMKTFALFSTNKIRKKVKFSAKNFFFKDAEFLPNDFPILLEPLAAEDLL